MTWHGILERINRFLGDELSQFIVSEDTGMATIFQDLNLIIANQGKMLVELKTLNTTASSLATMMAAIGADIAGISATAAKISTSDAATGDAAVQIAGDTAAIAAAIKKLTEEPQVVGIEVQPGVPATNP